LGICIWAPLLHLFCRHLFNRCWHFFCRRRRRRQGWIPCLTITLLHLYWRLPAIFCRTLSEEGVRRDCVGGRGLGSSCRGWTCRRLGSRVVEKPLGSDSAGLSKAGHIRWALFTIRRGLRQQMLPAIACRRMLIRDID
jgi:hypothetical protein